MKIINFWFLLERISEKAASGEKNEPKRCLYINILPIPRILEVYSKWLLKDAGEIGNEESIERVRHDSLLCSAFALRPEHIQKHTEWIFLGAASSSYFFFCCFRNRKKEWMEKEKLNSPGSRLLISFSDSYSNHKNRDDWKMENLLRFLSLFLFPFSCLPPIDFINSCFASFSKSRESDIIEVLLDCDAYVFLSLLCTLPKRQLSSKCSNFYFSKHSEEEGKRAENWLTDNWQLSISASTSAQPVVKSFRLNSRVLFFLFALKKKHSAGRANNGNFIDMQSWWLAFCQGRRSDVSCCVCRFADMRRTNKYKTHK